MKRELNFLSQSPLLYLVATPIGNLQEFSPRAQAVLSSMDYIACEDTRNSGQLFKDFAIDKPLISCHEHNEEEASAKIVALLLAGKKVAYVSDAGYPCLSDPGLRLVRKCLENGINVSTVNGSSAFLSALCASGLDSTHFYFEGFLPSKPSERDEEIAALGNRKETLVLYEAPHRISKTLASLAKILGPRNACLARELTKAHEEFIRGSLSDLADLDEATLIGEMVLIIEGKKEEKHDLSDAKILALLKEELKKTTPKEAVRKVSTLNSVSKNRVYSLFLSLKK
jgi:16S rRNA (cytidine1402-2'-O)-methyltransferase